MGRRSTEKWGGVYVLIACTALALALYSCSGTPARQQPTPPPTIASIAPTPIPATHAATAPLARSAETPTLLPSTNSRPTPSPIPETSTNQQSTPQPLTAPTAIPTPTPVPDFVPLPADAQFTQITAGRFHACGLQADGSALCWGRNISGALIFPGGNPTLSRISAGEYFTCGLSIDYTIACWGQNNLGQASPPNGRFDEIAAGSDHACALNAGNLTCWGRGFRYGPEAIQEVPQLSAIHAGLKFTCGLTPNADMACLDNGRRELTITPGPFADIGIGLHHACAMRVDGNAFCRVANSRHQYNTGVSHPPPTKFVQISAGWHHACGITEASDIECWGSGAPGAAGQRMSAPEGKFEELAIGWRNSCALNTDGYATCWRQPDVQNPSGLQEAFGGIEFEQPTDLFPLPDGRLAVVERRGIIAAYSDEPNAAPRYTMLDLTDKTICCDYETGMFSAVLDPQFEEFPFLYVYYRVVSKHAYGENMPGLATRLARLRVERGKIVRDSELTILDVAQPRNQHFGGAMRFSADGMLYLGIGENRRTQKAQRLDTLQGKIIRIDVRDSTPEQPYRVPPDNPFVDNPNALPEIWAYGLRNPWRMDFASDGRLFIADVGNSAQEEISLAAAGDNLGWPLCQGNVCIKDVEANDEGLTAPIYTYGRDEGCAIIGGVTAPRLNNGFIFGDYCSGRVWILEQDEREGWRTRLLAQMEGQILSFGMDDDGTVYALTRGNPIMRLQIDGE